jgi:hypothetical protein
VFSEPAVLSVPQSAKKLDVCQCLNNLGGLGSCLLQLSVSAGVDVLRRNGFRSEKGDTLRVCGYGGSVNVCTIWSE